MEKGPIRFQVTRTTRAGCRFLYTVRLVHGRTVLLRSGRPLYWVPVCRVCASLNPNIPIELVEAAE